ncbi:hypothetical protein cypCar_00046712, partial [Cyprinus carpio]
CWFKRVPHGAVELPDYDGFVIPNRFVVGYALDYNERPQFDKHIRFSHPIGQQAGGQSEGEGLQSDRTPVNVANVFCFGKSESLSDSVRLKDS